MSKKAFDKFINKPIGGAKKKEKLRQEKKTERRERRAAIEESKRKRYERESGIRSQSSTVAPKSYSQNKKEYPTPERTSSYPKKNFSSSENKNIHPSKRKIAGEELKGKGKQKTGNLDSKVVHAIQRETRNEKQETRNEKQETRNKKRETRNEKRETPSSQSQTPAEQMPLNKFIAHCGVCGRREAAALIKQGKIKVNDDIILEPGFKVTGHENIIVNGKAVHLQKNLVYILLNKPKDYITTVSDPEGRKTVLDLIKGARAERMYPVGRLDRNTTGVLLLTNDGELAQKLTHPSYQVKKIYEVTLDKVFTKNHLEQFVKGITLEDGFVAADSIAYADPKDKKIVGIEIHSGRNRIVRRMFEHLGYDVKNLDRVMFANLTKKNVDRGKWRYLAEKEVRQLKFLNQGFIKKEKVT